MFRDLEQVRVEPTKIIYKPHCGNCGFLIDSEIEYQDIYENIGKGSTTIRRRISTIIYPNKCENCGALFCSIGTTPPKKLPDVHL